MRRVQQLLVVLLLPLLFVGDVPVLAHAEVVRELWNLGHVLVFYLLTRVVCDKVLLWKPGVATLAWTVSGLIALGLGIEIVQRAIGRDFSWYDWGFDIAGCILAALHYLPGLERWPRQALRLLLIGLCLLPLGREVRVEWRLYQQLPYLFRADSGIALQQMTADGEVRQVFTDAARRVSADVAAVINVQFVPRRYSNLSLPRIVPDWSAWQQLRMDIANPQPYAVVITCRVHDVLHEQGNWRFNDRFNRTFTLPPGRNHLQIPLRDILRAPVNRPMDLTQMANIICFSMNTPATFSLDIAAIYLE